MIWRYITTALTIAAQEVGRWEQHVCLAQLAGGKISSGVPQLTLILKGSLPFLPRLCQFSESTLLDLWPHLKYSMHPSSIFHGIPESLYYCLKCHCYPTRHGLVRTGSCKWKNRGCQITLTQIKKYGISHFWVTFKGWWFAKTDCQIALVAGCSCCLLRLLLLTFDLRSWKTAVTHSREG